MLISDAKKLLKEMISKKIHVSTVLWGPAGIGKSQMVFQVAKEMGYKIIDLRLSQKEAVDVGGMPYTKDFDDKDKVLGHYLPEWFMQAKKEGKTILFLDELNRAKPDTLQAIFELALDRKLNGEYLPDDVHIVVACNPANSKYDTIEFDDALTSRFMHIQVRTSVESWLEWATGDDSDGTPKVHKDVIRYIKKDPSALNIEDAEDMVFPIADEKIRPKPRLWEFVSKLEELEEVSNSIKRECVRGLIGTTFMPAYFASKVDRNSPITLEEVLEMTEDKNDPTRLKVKDFSSGERPRQDLLEVTCNDIVKSKDKIPQELREKVLEFLSIIPADKAYAVIKAIYKEWASEIMKNEKMIKISVEAKKAQDSTRGS